MIQVTGWQYRWRRYLGWMPFQPCIYCGGWYWGGFPYQGWQAVYQEYCSTKCHREGEGRHI